MAYVTQLKRQKSKKVLLLESTLTLWRLLKMPAGCHPGRNYACTFLWRSVEQV